MPKRYGIALLCGFLAMAAHVYFSFGAGNWFVLQRVGSAVSAGLIFGHGVGFAAWAASSRRHWLLSLAGGCLFGVLAWWAYLTLFLYHSAPDWGVLLLGGAGIGAAFSLRIEPLLLRAAFAVVFIYAPIYASYQQYLATLNTPSPTTALLYFRPDYPELVWIIGLPFALLLALGGIIK